jgi:WhiB family redox-sensing transcriptional regulator
MDENHVPRWQDQALCRGVDPEVFFPTIGGTAIPAKSLYCSGCPVSDPCLEAGLHENFGVWGGTSERERRKIRRDRHMPPKPALTDKVNRLAIQHQRTEKMRAAEVCDVTSIEAWLADHRKTS